MGMLMRRLEQYQRCAYWGKDLTEPRWKDVLAELRKVRTRRRSAPPRTGCTRRPRP